MKSKTIIITILLLLATFALAASLTPRLIGPSNLSSVTSSTTVDFSWEVNSTDGFSIIPAYLYVSQKNNESNLVLNRTVFHCRNATTCNSTVTNFIPGFYQWKVIVGQNATRPNSTSSNSGTFDLSASNNLSLSYSHNGTVQSCSLNLEASATANSTSVASNISSLCSYIGAFSPSSTGQVSIYPLDYGIDSYLNILPTSNASSVLGLSNVTGSQINFTSSTFWVEVIGPDNVNATFFSWQNKTGFEAMKLNKNTGELYVESLNLSVSGSNKFITYNATCLYMNAGTNQIILCE